MIKVMLSYLRKLYKKEIERKEEESRMEEAKELQRKELLLRLEHEKLMSNHKLHPSSQMVLV